MKLVFFGPPGSGKGTQAKLLTEKFKLPHISLGDMLRQEVRAESDIGQRAKALINAGKLVPDELTIELTRQRLNKPDCKNGFVLDGYPRSQAQADALEEILADLKWQLDKMVYFQVDEDKVVERLSGRRSCKTCGAVYHVKFNQPKVAGKCDQDGSELYQRKDDVESAIRTRFEVYAEQTEPLLERYKKSEKLATVEAAGSIEQVFKRLLTVIGYGGN
ncbi:MAG: adenylate kinase [Candidatus Margulisbacteria bacterium]|nr:adenylate kinase [Candidatus Margulisiibacteriota bacterium]